MAVTGSTAILPSHVLLENHIFNKDSIIRASFDDNRILVLHEGGSSVIKFDTSEKAKQAWDSFVHRLLTVYIP